MSIDHPRVRRMMTCPICGESKTIGCVWCWPCHRATQHQYTDEQRERAEATLDETEELLIAAESFPQQAFDRFFQL